MIRETTRRAIQNAGQKAPDTHFLQGHNQLLQCPATGPITSPFKEALLLTTDQKTVCFLFERDASLVGTRRAVW